MQYTFARRVEALQPSAIREILKFTSQPGYIPFSAGNPAPEAFPTKQIGEISARIFAERPVDALQYSITEGYPELRAYLSDYMKRQHNVGREFDSLIVTSGAQQVMELSAKALCNEGDTIICETPSFIGSLNAFRSFGLKLRGVPMDPDGMNLDALEQALKTEPNARFIYTIPNFQNPSSITMSLEKRRAVYELAKRYGVMIVEDNPYGDTRFAGDALPAIKSFDEDGIVIYAGTFSKVIAPGLRVGYSIAPAQVSAKLVTCKQVSDVHTNIWSQLIAYEFLTKYDFGAHLARIREIYRGKAGLMMRQFDEVFGKEVTYYPVQGGLFLWCTLPAGVDMQAYCKAAVEQKVAVVPGNAFLMDEAEPCSSFRVNYSTPTDEQLVRGVQILGDVFARMK